MKIYKLKSSTVISFQLTQIGYKPELCVAFRTYEGEVTIGASPEVLRTALLAALAEIEANQT